MKLRQRDALSSNKQQTHHEPKSPTPSSESINSDDSWGSSLSHNSRSTTPDKSEIKLTSAIHYLGVYLAPSHSTHFSKP